MADEEKKLIIDDDWKHEAQKEKEILEAQEKEAKAKKQQAPTLPDADFQGLLSVFATQAYLALGLLKTSEDAEPIQDFPMAKYNIDMLAVIQDKTQGNLSDDETQMLEEAVSNLRMAFVQLSGSAS